MRNHDVLLGFADALARDPAKVALEHGPRRLTYGELDGGSSALAAALGRVGPGAIVGVCLDDPVARVAALLGIWKAGAIYAPIDLELPAARLERTVAHLAPAAFVGEAGSAAERAARLPGAGAVPWCTLDASRGTAAWELGEPPAGEAASERRPGLAPDDPCYVFQTSGSTGEPKHILGRYRGVGHFVAWEAGLLGLDETVRVSQLTSPFFDAWLRDVFVPLTLGGTLAIPETPELRLDAVALAAWIEQAEITLVHSVPSLFRAVAAGGLHPQRFPRLCNVLLSGEPILQADAARWLGAFGERVALINLYGPSETTMTKLFHRVTPADLSRQRIPIGRPIPGAAALLVDGRDRPCPPGTVGEILLRTPFRSLGYLRQPELSAAAFVPNPVSGDADDLIYRTGDLGRLLPDGAFDFLGRRDGQVKVRGQRIETAEIEGALAAHPRVREAAVVERPDAAGTSTLAAFFVAGPGGEGGEDGDGELTARELRQWLLRFVPAYMAPDRFVPVASLPRTRTGKVDRRALAGADLKRQAGAAKVAPRGDTEERLAEIWCGLLELPFPGGAGVEDDFFEAGGHSLMATRLLLAAQQAFGVELSLAAFLERPTLAALAEAVDGELLLAADPERLAALLAEMGGGESA